MNHHQRYAFKQETSISGWKEKQHSLYLVYFNWTSNNLARTWEFCLHIAKGREGAEERERDEVHMLDTGVYVFMPCSGLVYITEQSCKMLSPRQYISLFCLDEN